MTETPFRTLPTNIHCTGCGWALWIEPTQGLPHRFNIFTLVCKNKECKHFEQRYEVLPKDIEGKRL